MKRRAFSSDTTSNDASSTFLGSRNSTIGTHKRKKQLIAKKYSKYAPKTVKLDPKESIIQVAYQLPYRLISKEAGQFIVEPSY